MNDLSPYVKIGNIPIGDGFPTALMAEIGTFFNQDIELATSFLKSIISSGANIFKTEILHDPDICLKENINAKYNYSGGTKNENYRELIERKVVSLKKYEELFSICRDYEFPFVCSVYDTIGIDFVVDMGGSGIKFARDNVSNIGLLRYAAKTDLPIIIDAGNLYLSEIAQALEVVNEYNSNNVIICHHPAANPAPSNVHNLKVINSYKRIFKVPVGLSCHYRGDEIMYAAVAVGANIIEKGVVDNPDKIEQDLVSALKIDDLPKVVSKIRNCYEAMGKDTWDVLEPRDKISWKGMVAKTNILEGDEFKLQNIGFAFPPKGIPANHWDVIDGKCANRNIKKGEILKWEYIDFT